MEFVVITGMSGAGKSCVMNALEDIGFFCVDNLPLELVGKFAELAASPAQEYSKVALGLDVRSLYKGRSSVDGFLEIMKGYQYEILFMDASEETLIRRYKETRRAHPLAAGGDIAAGIEKEREKLSTVKSLSSFVIDTSELKTAQLSSMIKGLLGAEDKDSFILTVRKSSNLTGRILRKPVLTQRTSFRPPAFRWQRTARASASADTTARSRSFKSSHPSCPISFLRISCSSMTRSA